MRGRPNCDAHSPVNRFEPCNNSTTCAEYSLNGTVATACLALLEGDCLSVPMFTYPCSVCCLLSDEYAIRLPRIMYASIPTHPDIGSDTRIPPIQSYIFKHLPRGSP